MEKVAINDSSKLVAQAMDILMDCRDFDENYQEITEAVILLEKALKELTDEI